jgi:hypothetical protein
MIVSEPRGRDESPRRSGPRCRFDIAVSGLRLGGCAPVRLKRIYPLPACAAGSLRFRSNRSLRRSGWPPCPGVTRLTCSGRSGHDSAFSVEDFRLRWCRCRSAALSAPRPGRGRSATRRGWPCALVRAPDTRPVRRCRRLPAAAPSSGTPASDALAPLRGGSLVSPLVPRTPYATIRNTRTVADRLRCCVTLRSVLSRVLSRGTTRLSTAGDAKEQDFMRRSRSIRHYG